MRLNESLNNTGNALRTAAVPSTDNTHFTPPSDGWFEIVPKGNFPHRESGAVQVIDDRALQSMAVQFNREASSPNWPGLLVDFDHFSYDTQKPSEAAGWLHAVENRADGLYGRIRWTDTGAAAISNGRYRFLSPTWLAADTEVLADGQSSGGGTTLVRHSLGDGGSREMQDRSADPARTERWVRPIRLDSLALTNSPNLRGMVPLSNRSRGCGASGHNSLTQPPSTRMKSISTMLGLSPEASEEAIQAEVAKLQTRLSAAEQAAAPLRNRVTELEANHAALLAAQVESDLELFKNRYPAAAREKWKKQLLHNRADALDLLQSLPENSARPAVVHNRAQAGNPGERMAREVLSEAGALTGAGGVAQAAAIRNRASELRAANNKLSYEQSWRLAKAELEPSASEQE